MSSSETIVLDTRLLTASDSAIAIAAGCLRSGGLVAFPTETVYGLGADATNAAAIARLYAAKGRPAFNPLISHVAGIDEARLIGRFDATAERLAAAFWPGPLTLVLPKAADCRVADLATAGLDTIAIRVPVHPVAQALLRAVRVPVVAPSANLSGHVSPTAASHVQADLNGRIDLILDGGAVDVGVESTVIGCFATAMLLRPGGVPSEAIEAVLGRPLARPVAEPSSADSQPLAPGMLSSHYAPNASVRLDAISVATGEALLAFGPDLPPGSEHAAAVMNLSESGDLAEAATHLFGYLRALDAKPDAKAARAIAVMPIPHDGLGEAINDRLRRAAAPKE
jgi:L-threonylcarbamoyladenylate synthase